MSGWAWTGLDRALDTGGPATSAELAWRTGIAERYVREWLEHHAASRLLEVGDPAAGPLARRYRLPAGHVPVLADPDDVRYRAFNGVEIVRAGRWLLQLVEAFRFGSAPAPLPWTPEGRAEYNRAVFLNLLVLKALRGSAIPGCPKPCADVVRSASWPVIRSAARPSVVHRVEQRLVPRLDDLALDLHAGRQLAAPRPTGRGRGSGSP